MPSERAKQEAADRANKIFPGQEWEAKDATPGTVLSVAAEALDELHAIKADMAEIDRIAVDDGWPLLNDRDPPARVFDIAARHREVDPLLIEAQDLYANWADKSGVEIALAALKRGIEIGGKAS